MRRVAVFAGHSELETPEALAAAHQVGKQLAEQSLTMLYDGAEVGSIGTVAQSALAAGGRVVGLVVGDDQATPHLTERRNVASAEAFRTEVAMMADAFLALPNGFATLADALGVWSWASAAEQKPLGLLDRGGYFSELVKHAPDETLDRFVRESQRGQLIIGTDPTEVIRRLAEFRAPETRRIAAFEEP